jgi:hypothetical protein
MEEGGDAVCSKSAAGTFKNLNQFAENSSSHKNTTSGSVRIDYKQSVPLKGRKVESEGEVGDVCAASQTGVNLPRLAVAQTHPNPRGSVRPSGCGPCVGNTIGAQTTNRRFLLAFRPHQPTLAPPPSPAPPTKNIVFSLISLAETHGSYQGKIHQPLSFIIPTADLFRRYRQQTARKSTGGDLAPD